MTNINKQDPFIEWIKKAKEGLPVPQYYKDVVTLLENGKIAVVDILLKKELEEAWVELPN